MKVRCKMKTMGEATHAPQTVEDNIGEKMVLAGNVHDTPRAYPEAFVFFLSVLCRFLICFSKCFKMLKAFIAVG